MDDPLFPYAEKLFPPPVLAVVEIFQCTSEVREDGSLSLGRRIREISFVPPFFFGTGDLFPLLRCKKLRIFILLVKQFRKI